MRLLLFFGVLLITPAVRAQRNVEAAGRSPMTGIALPPGSKLDQRGLVRAAVRMTIDMEATEAGGSLGDRYEVFQLPLLSGEEIVNSIALALLDEGYSLAGSAPNSQVTWVQKEEKQYLCYLELSDRENWLYIAEVKTLPPGMTQSNPEQPLQETHVSPEPDVSPVQQPSVQDAHIASAHDGYYFGTTTFDDGWTATIHPDYILVKKAPYTCYLFYRVVMSEEMEPPMNNIDAYFWRRDVKPRFDVLTEDRRRAEFMFSPIEYTEGEAIDKATGRRVFVGMNVSRNSGGALNIVVVAPDKESYYKEFSQPENLERMLGYNKFAVAASDLIGHWSSSSGAFAQMYYVATGGYAGMNAVSTSAEFWIEANGTYRSEHKGASGMVGSQQFFQQEYKGSYKMNGEWEVKMTNRYNGKDETFHCWFEVLRVGRILHLQDVQYSGMTYQLVKVR